MPQCRALFTQGAAVYGWRAPPARLMVTQLMATQLMAVEVHVICITPELFKSMILFADICLLHHVILSTSCTFCFAFQKLLSSCGWFEHKCILVSQRQTCFYEDCSGDTQKQKLIVQLKLFPFPAVGSLILQIVQFRLVAGQKKPVFPDSLLFQKVFQCCLKSRNVFCLFFISLKSMETKHVPDIKNVF